MYEIFLGVAEALCCHMELIVWVTVWQGGWL